MRYWSLAFAAIPAAYAGEHSLTTARVEQCRELAGQVGFDISLHWAGWARAVLALSEGDPETADAALAPIVSMFEEHGVPEPIVGFFLPDAIEAMISTGQLERAGPRRLSVGQGPLASRHALVRRCHSVAFVTATAVTFSPVTPATPGTSVTERIGASTECT